MLYVNGMCARLQLPEMNSIVAPDLIWSPSSRMWRARRSSDRLWVNTESSSAHGSERRRYWFSGESLFLKAPHILCTIPQAVLRRSTQSSLAAEKVPLNRLQRDELDLRSLRDSFYVRATMPIPCASPPRPFAHSPIPILPQVAGARADLQEGDERHRVGVEDEPARVERHAVALLLGGGPHRKG